ncbi:hypothetical protein D3C84_1158020 [compost metagenome]
MALDELAVDHCGVTGRKPWCHSQTLFDQGHVGFDMIDDLEAIGFEVRDPLLAAAAVGVAVHIDVDRLGRLARGPEEQGRQSGGLDAGPVQL